ncbi:hypothetical protein HYPSUDRAFT_42103 [Hypholoma sublateritium FD-334 SS-4]|uniref:Uncharacterized protein n=1 Tax=Hypholoma sublateritium (strain FD-334 SS-4) TaxID=945553 RepID=A0A0D2L3S5_HYPSF|nr:hypothetical protein HYPSUDRAFT_42103 [Hypholoma sublateritium FD-334 SS-4]
MNIVTCPDLGSNQHTPDAMESTSPRIVGSRRVELPFDIYTYIIDLVAKTYYPLHMEDIKAMSLVRRALVAPCQKFLFRSVTYSVKVARKLLQIHDASPHLVDYVRQLDLKFSADHRSDIDRPSEVTVEFFNKFRNLSRLDFAFNSRNMLRHSLLCSEDKPDSKH